MNLRTPTTMASSALTANIEASLATLLGLMITGNEAFNEKYAADWVHTDHTAAEMDVFSQNWINPTKVAAWEGFRVTLEEFRDAQMLVEGIANTPKEQPALKTLVTDAAPLGSSMVANLRGIIDYELETARAFRLGGIRILILGMMADVQGILGLGLASIRSYLLTGDANFVEEFVGL